MNDMILKLQQIEQNILNTKLKYIKKDITSSLDKIYTLQIENAQYYLKLYYTKHKITLNLHKLKDSRSIYILKYKTEINSKLKILNIFITTKFKSVIENKFRNFNKLMYYKRDKIYNNIKDKMVYKDKKDRSIKHAEFIFNKWMHLIVNEIEMFLCTMNKYELDNSGNTITYSKLVNGTSDYLDKNEMCTLKNLNNELSLFSKSYNLNENVFASRDEQFNNELIGDKPTTLNMNTSTEHKVNDITTSIPKFKQSSISINLIKNDKFNNIEISTESINNLHSFNSTETNNNNHYFTSSEIRNLRKDSEAESNHEFYSTTTNCVIDENNENKKFSDLNLIESNMNLQKAENFFVSKQRESELNNCKFKNINTSINKHKYNNTTNFPIQHKYNSVNVVKEKNVQSLVKFNTKDTTVVQHKFNKKEAFPNYHYYKNVDVKTAPDKFTGVNVETNQRELSIKSTGHEINENICTVCTNENKNHILNSKNVFIEQNNNEKNSFNEHTNDTQNKKNVFNKSEFSTKQQPDNPNLNKINKSSFTTHVFNFSESNSYKIKPLNRLTKANLKIHETLFKYGQFLFMRLNTAYDKTTKNLHLDNVKLHILISLIRLRCNFLNLKNIQANNKTNNDNNNTNYSQACLNNIDKKNLSSQNNNNIKNNQTVYNNSKTFDYDRIFFILQEGNLNCDKQFYEMIEDTIQEIDKYKDPVVIRMGIQFILAKKYVKNIIDLKESVKM